MNSMSTIPPLSCLRSKEPCMRFKSSLRIRSRMFFTSFRSLDLLRGRASTSILICAKRSVTRLSPLTALAFMRA